MRYAGIIYNSIADCDNGVSLSLYLQGCPHHCKGCHNKETWDENGGTEIERSVLIEKIKNNLHKNDIKRNFSVLGGEPLAPYNVKDTLEIIKEIKKYDKSVKVYLWSGYYLKEIRKMKIAKEVLKYVDVLIDGRFELSKRDVTLSLRGSSNQNIYKKKKIFFFDVLKKSIYKKKKFFSLMF